MADSSLRFLKKTHFQDPNPTSFASSMPTKPPKSKFLFSDYFFSKSMVIVLALLVFTYFPSQVPEFFKKTTILTKLWELIYLLVIGIAVCYGLFSRKVDSVHSSDESAHSDDNFGEKETYLSGISHISSIFEDGIQNSYGFDVKDLSEERNGSGSRFSDIGNGFGKSDSMNLNQCFLGESMVVINDEKYVLEQLGKQKTVKQNKPLCLPVRNLGSKNLDSAAGKSVNDSTNNWDETKNEKYRGLVPIKLEDKFKETDSDSDSRTLLNWRSKSMRLEKREDMFSTESNETSNFRPTSVGVHDIGGQKSHSMRFSMPFQMKSSLEKDEFKRMETKSQENSIGGSSEMNDLNRSSSKDLFEEFGEPKVDDGNLDLNNNATFSRSKSQQSSIGASSEINVETFKNVLGKEKKANSFDSIPSPSPTANPYKRGISVRTNRPKEQVVEAKVKVFPSQTDDKDSRRSTDVILDEPREMDELSDTEPHSGEVDRKAAEFIAKFREQIRLQKLASARKLNL